MPHQVSLITTVAAGLGMRTHSEEEMELLRQEGLGTVFMGAYELAQGMARHVLDRMALPAGGS
jgi:CPA2 family monovalent cation:H+ antiporter-2